MKVTTVSANIRYSQDTGHGAWKVVELGAEATVGEREQWAHAQAQLYHQVGQQLKTLWANGTGNKAQDGSESHGELVAAPEPVKIPQSISARNIQTEFANTTGVIMPGTATRRRMGSGVRKSKSPKPA